MGKNGGYTAYVFRMYLTISENGIIKETAKVCFDDFELGIG